MVIVILLISLVGDFLWFFLLGRAQLTVSIMLSVGSGEGMRLGRGERGRARRGSYV